MEVSKIPRWLSVLQGAESLKSKIKEANKSRLDKRVLQKLSQVTRDLDGLCRWA